MALYIFVRDRQMSRRAARLAGRTHKLDFLPNERGPVICMSPPSSTVTFFRGPRGAAEQHLSQRVTAIVLANPWLASILEYDENGALAGLLRFSSRSNRVICPSVCSDFSGLNEALRS